MPLYEYICQDCGYRFDSLRSIKQADEPISCIKCSSLHTKRALSVFNAHSGGRVIAGSKQDGCAGCSGGTCSSCGH
jgi:putative FmdB family regulatory protein